MFVLRNAFRCCRKVVMLLFLLRHRYIILAMYYPAVPCLKKCSPLFSYHRQKKTEKLQSHTASLIYLSAVV